MDCAERLKESPLPVLLCVVPLLAPQTLRHLFLGSCLWWKVLCSRSFPIYKACTA